MTSEAKIIVSAEDRNTRAVFARVRSEIQGAGKSADGLRAGLSLLAPAVAGALSVAGIAAFVKGANEGLLKIKDLSEATGASVENISGLENVLRAAGGSIDDASKLLLKFNLALKDADGKNGFSQVLNAIGLEAKALKDADPAQALLDFAVAFDRLPEGGNKGRLLIEAFGRDARIAGPALRELAEAGRLVSTVTAEQVRDADKLTKEFAKLSNNAEDLARVLNSKLVPALNSYAEKVRGLPKNANIFGAEVISELQSVLLSLVVAKIEDLQGALRADPGNSGIIKALKAARDGYDALSRSAAAANEKLKQTIGPVTGQGRRPANEGGGGLASRTFTPVTPATAAAQTDADRYIESLRRQLQGTQDLTLTETVLAEIRGGSLKAASAGERQRALGLASEIEGTREVVRLARERSDQRNAENAEIDKFVAAQKAANEQRVRAILGATPTAQLKEALVDIELVGKEFDAGRISAEQWAEAVKGVSAPLGVAADEVEKLGTFAEQAGRNIQDGLGETLRRTLRGDFESIGELWRNLLVDMAAQAAAAQLNKVLFGGLFGGGGTGSGAIGGALSGLFAGFGGFFADGGTLGAGRWGIAGEAGPEIVRGPATITPMSEASGSMTVQIINNINGDVGSATVRLVESAMGRVKADILRSRRDGGVFA